MADITKCSGSGCIARHTCVRFTELASKYQSMFRDVPGKDENCEFYWKEERCTDRSKSNTRRLEVLQGGKKGALLQLIRKSSE